MIEELLRDGVSHDEIVRRVVEELGIPEDQARFMVALVSGEIEGDFLEVDENGNEHSPPSTIVE